MMIAPLLITLGIKDVIDILLVAIILYSLWRIMKQSSAANIFSGILIFIVVWILVSRVFEMRLLGTILDNLVNIGAITIVILFQEEIRHFLSSIGSNQIGKFLKRFFLTAKRKDESNNKDEILAIVMSCLGMSKQKVGALIVIERTVPLSNVIRSGDVIDAKINQRLIENIFFKNSPLHDGALIVSQHRIAAAGCILPVSHDSNIPKALGLRHRSALGISQKSDCLAIIVSEETGGISVAVNGAFHLRLTAEELERTLTKEWIL